MSTAGRYSCLRLILGDQLHAGHSWFRTVDPDVLYVLAELPQELGYVRHHRQKVLAFFAAMQTFARALAQADHAVLHLTLDDTKDHASLPELLNALCSKYDIERFEYQQPDEYRLDRQLSALSRTLPCPVTCVDSEHFLTPRDAWNKYPNTRLEYFYRALRKEYRVLLTPEGTPEGGQWNYDAENRQRLPDKVELPEPLKFAHNVSAIEDRLRRHQVETIGEADPERLIWPVSRAESRQLLAYFLRYCLADFGRYQDALPTRGWSLFHSRLSFSLNTKMLHPLEVIRAAEDHWRANSDDITLAQVEGFIRQVLGWREYVRALYWAKMPDYRSTNHLQASRPLPGWYWTGQTGMACLAGAIDQSLQYAYAHHIQRLMVTGTFALLAGIDPDEVDAWYLGIYVDAIEWVELPNTRGMSQYADGGLLASKPYAASGQYINKMGDYCKHCRYKVKERTGPDSCPLNSLYWHFLHRHEERLQDNPRLKLVYANWRRQPVEQQRAILDTAESYLGQLETL
ncbi:MAG: cryptochrome/photolyase family protein [Natronospirillum sp.]|uniref:cryptochrome/photolyase family protein n=1 Tax=Natronospirillum sp. TaxID=2812955 RepID=UPI0025E39AF2|nr:cryptochrome/photolyase family protein [Natronospirillum sp.]MCH8551737.1 cryptochrome/photolyase family protein [Natronospirillum sp.]